MTKLRIDRREYGRSLGLLMEVSQGRRSQKPDKSRSDGQCSKQDQPDLVGVGARLQKARQDCGLSTGEISKGLGLSEVAYAGLETGNVLLDLSTALEISKLMGVSLDWLAGGDRGDTNG